MFLCALAALAVWAVPVSASTEVGHSAVVNPAMTFLEVAVILIAAKLFSFVERLKQPAVLGELLVGVLLGNAVLLGVHWFDGFKTDPNVRFLAELGVAVLLFKTGLESNVAEMRKVGLRAFLIALAGVVITFGLGAFVVAPWLLPELPPISHYFIGAALTATSVGISARVFSDLGKQQTKEARLVIGAAVLDDVMGLVVLAVITGLITAGSVSIGLISVTLAKSVGFLVGAIVVGQLLAPKLSVLLSRIHSGVGTKFTFAIGFFLLFGYGAQLFGLAPIIGAFAAGLVLDPVHFRSFKSAGIVEELKDRLAGEEHDLKQSVLSVVQRHEERHVDDLIEPLSHFLVPIFFVLTGMNVDLHSFANTSVLLLALGLTVVAFVGKYCSSFFAGSVQKPVVGFGMVPRGEVQLIFAAMGQALGVISADVFSAIVIVVIATTILSPICLSWVMQTPADVAAPSRWVRFLQVPRMAYAALRVRK